MEQISEFEFICPCCEIKKDKSEFNVAAKRKYGITGICKACIKISKIKQLSKVEAFLLSSISTSKAFSKKRKINKEFNIDAKYLKTIYDSQNGLCAITKIPMTTILGQGKIATNISLDRIDFERGYIKGNIQLLCYVVNIMKQRMNNSEIKKFIITSAKNILLNPD